LTSVLPAEQAEVLMLRVVGGLPVEEVARVVGKRPGTVRVLQHRALRRLASQLRDNFPLQV
jgi:RNA polymerase sigma-70 factor (ECF subfamily)